MRRFRVTQHFQSRAGNGREPVGRPEGGIPPHRDAALLAASGMRGVPVASTPS